MKKNDIKNVLENTFNYKEHTYIKNAGANYINYLVESINILKKFLKTSQLKSLINDKLKINKNSFDEKQYIQTCCEITLQKYLAERFPDSFIYENKVNPNNNKDVEGSIKIDGCLINIEMKCATYKEKEEIDTKEGFKISTYGRHPFLQRSFIFWLF